MLKKDSPLVLQNIYMIARQLFLLFKKSTTFWDNPRTLTFIDVYTNVKRKSSPFQEKNYLQISTRKDPTFKNISALSPLQITGKRNDFENPIH